MDFAANTPHHEVGHAPPALALIDVRIGAIGDGEIAVVGEALREVAVEIQGDADGEVRPERRPPAYRERLAARRRTTG